MSGFLASVASLEEARLVAAAGADVVDLKDPAAGALGALSPAAVAGVVRALAGGQRSSAVAGTSHLGAAELVAAVQAIAATGVDFVKLGLHTGAGFAECVARLDGCLEPPPRLVAVLFADTGPDLDVLPRLARAGFGGVMLDTWNKAGGGLREHLAPAALAGFVARARDLGLVTGLAGCLRLADLPALLPLRPDYLGFRGALCGTGERAGRIDPAAVAALAAALH